MLKFTLQDSIEEKFHGELHRLMHLDSLTGLYVRRWFDQEYPRLFERAHAEASRLCVLMMDLDGLKAVNDRHAHQMGSYCIAEAGKIIRRCIEPNGAGARFGVDDEMSYKSGAFEATLYGGPPNDHENGER